MSDLSIVILGIGCSLFAAWVLRGISIDSIELEAHRLGLTGLKFRDWVKWRSGEF